MTIIFREVRNMIINFDIFRSTTNKLIKNIVETYLKSYKQVPIVLKIKFGQIEYFVDIWNVVFVNMKTICYYK